MKILKVVKTQDHKFEINLYGFETSEPISVIGISMTLIFLFKALTAYSLLREKNWAITLGITDAIIGLALCSFAMLYPLLNSNSGVSFTFRLELVLLIPYLLKLLKIKPDWEKSTSF